MFSLKFLLSASCLPKEEESAETIEKAVAATKNNLQKFFKILDNACLKFEYRHENYTDFFMVKFLNKSNEVFWFDELIDRVDKCPQQFLKNKFYIKLLTAMQKYQATGHYSVDQVKNITHRLELAYKPPKDNTFCTKILKHSRLAASCHHEYNARNIVLSSARKTLYEKPVEYYVSSDEKFLERLQGDINDFFRIKTLEAAIRSYCHNYYLHYRSEDQNPMDILGFHLKQSTCTTKISQEVNEHIEKFLPIDKLKSMSATFN